MADQLMLLQKNLLASQCGHDMIHSYSLHINVSFKINIIVFRYIYDDCMTQEEIKLNTAIFTVNKMFVIFVIIFIS